LPRQYLIPRSLERNGLQQNQVRYTRDALLYIANGYAREAGVRNFEKNLDKIHRKLAKQILETNPDYAVQAPRRNGKEKFAIDKAGVEKYLGKPIFAEEEVKRADRPGMAVGLAWTSMGGATLPIEATRIHTLNRGFKLTGQLGEVMKESAEIAYSYVSSNLKSFGGDPKFFDEAFVHLHVPEGATPKDGPALA